MPSGKWEPIKFNFLHQSVYLYSVCVSFYVAEFLGSVRHHASLSDCRGSKITCFLCVIGVVFGL